VTVIRQAYRAKFAVCDSLLTGRYGYRRPAGGFFLWLDMAQLGGAEAAALTIWKRSGVKVLPGVYLAHEDRNGVNPGTDFIRVALVHDAATVREALERIVTVTA
jgi:aspartate/methionine/tyrosine aminotransferase